MLLQTLYMPQQRWTSALRPFPSLVFNVDGVPQLALDWQTLDTHHRLEPWHGHILAFRYHYLLQTTV
jgi:hypothetical protein